VTSPAAGTSPHRVPPLVAIVGATGTGKSAFALDLVEDLAAKGHQGEVINADAMQLYEGMDIGTAKLKVADRRGITHHLCDIWEVTREASVADYQALARGHVQSIQARGVVPILVGGSGLYVSSVLYEFEFPGTDSVVREQLEKRLEVEGREALVRELARQDPLAAVAIDSRNSRRLIRALEVVTLTGKPFGAGLDAQHHPWQHNLVVVGLHTERELLTKALDARVEAMWSEGLIEEVRRLIPRGIENGVTASRAIGYQQGLAVLSGELSQAEAIESTQALTRRYARRQVSWFRRDENTVWLASDEPARVSDATSLVTGALA